MTLLSRTTVAVVSLALLAVPAGAAKITMDCGTGSGFQYCKDEIEAWAKKTGNTAVALQTPNDSNQKIGLFQQQLAAKSPDVDVYQLDVVWPGVLGQHFVDLKSYLTPAEIKQYIPATIQNNTYQGKLVALPWFSEAGLLFYRTDLLTKYGYKSPPKTWAELQAMATKIQAGERKTNPKFMGYVFQGKDYEGLTCDALEWIKSYGGGSIVEPDGRISVNNPKAVAALKMAAGWVGTISPPAVTTYVEEDGRNAFQAGSVAFLRNWPYVYALANSKGSKVAGKIGVSPVPAGPGGAPAATLGGWQLGVNAYSKNVKEAVDLVKYMASKEVERERAIKYSFSPGILSLYDDPAVIKAQPFIGQMKPILANAVARPATATRLQYSNVSNLFATAVYNVLTKKVTPENSLANLEKQLVRAKGRGW